MFKIALLASFVMAAPLMSFADCTGRSVDGRCASYDFYSPVIMTNTSSATALTVNVSSGTGTGVSILGSTSAPGLTVTGSNVGIGTLSPSTTLEVAGLLRVSGNPATISGNRQGMTTTDGRLNIAAVTTPTDGAYISLYGPNFTGRGDYIDLVSANSGVIRFLNNTTATGVVTVSGAILANGNFGIGTTAPTAKLHVVGALKATSVNGFSNYLKTGNDGSNSCNTYCNNVSNSWGTDHGSCMGAKVSDNSRYYNCGDVPGVLGGSLQLHCMCMIF